jgi:bacterioferritin
MDNEKSKTAMHMIPGYSDPSPYPEIKVTAPNKYYAKILMDDYAGKLSELTAVNQYMYHKFSMMTEHKELSEILGKISIVEMHHLEMFAKMIKLLGYDPLFYNSANIPWNAKYVYYGKDICDQLKQDLKDELNTIIVYEQNIKIIKDPYIQDVLRRIILDEKVHVKIFEDQIKKYC